MSNKTKAIIVNVFAAFINLVLAIAFGSTFNLIPAGISMGAVVVVVLFWPN